MHKAGSCRCHQRQHPTQPEIKGRVSPLLIVVAPSQTRIAYEPEWRRYLGTSSKSHADRYRLVKNGPGQESPAYPGTVPLQILCAAMAGVARAPTYAVVG